jgi:hypothetical protein
MTVGEYDATLREGNCNILRTWWNAKLSRMVFQEPQLHCANAVVRDPERGRFA